MHTHLPEAAIITAISKRFRVTHARGPHCQLLWSATAHALRHRRCGPVFHRQLFQIKRVAPLLTCAAAGIKTISGKNCSAFATEMLGFENDVAGVGDYRKETRDSGYLFQREGIAELTTCKVSLSIIAIIHVAWWC